MFVVEGAYYKNRHLFSDVNHQSIEEAGIKECYRRMYLFIDKEEYDQFKNVQTGKLLLINYSMAYQHHSMYINNGNLLRFNNNIYTFNVEFITGFKDYLNAICSLETAFSSDAYNDLDNKRYVAENQLLFENLRSINNSFVKENLIDFEISSSTVIPDPKYYTPNHQFIAENEPPDALNTVQTQLVYRFEELKDDKTIIRVLPFNQWETFVKRKIQELRNIDYEVFENEKRVLTEQGDNLIENLFYFTSETMMEGIIFAYDSNVGDAMIHKSNMVTPRMSFYKHRFQEQVINSINQTKDLIKLHMNNLEKEYGNVLFFYSPFSHGDQFSIKFRDYTPDNQPSLTNSDNVDKINSLGVATDIFIDGSC